ncbi:MAG: hypothetical protein EAZ89_17915 [Bacteroidetes bacterium]|nr:MAG: hypothetical protein EAZ89_17915 [Bacteroidota bacterium]
MRGIFILLLLPLLLAAPAKAQTPFFGSEELLEFSLSTDLRAFLAERNDSASYRTALLTWNEDGALRKLEVEIKPRGNFRMKSNYCTFPPIRIKAKAETQNTPFEGMSRMRLMTPCAEDQYVLREYLVYRMYNMLTDTSFRVRLARVTYVDTEGSMSPVRSYAFFLEDPEEMAARLGATYLKKPSATDSMERSFMPLLHGFECMIGNTDWNVEIGKNIAMLSFPGMQHLVPVPYDFDWSEAVHAPYTGLDDEFDRRVFRRLCATQAEIEITFERFKHIRNQQKSLLRDFVLLEEEMRKEMEDLFDDFYRKISRSHTAKEYAVCP